jgi:hypothetical protein
LLRFAINQDDPVIVSVPLDVWDEPTVLSKHRDIANFPTTA